MRKIFIFFILLFTALPLTDCSYSKKEDEDREYGNDIKNNKVECNSILECITLTVNDLQSIFGKDMVPDITLFNTFIDSIGSELKKKYSNQLNGPALVDALIDIIYTKWNISFDPNQDDLQSLLPHTILSQKKSSCLGVSLLFLLLAEQLDYPLYGILLPGHFFVRYDDGKTYRNIEPNKKGYNHSFEYYRERYGIDDNSWYTMKNLSLKETAAVLYFNIANICLQAEKFDAAKKYYQVTISELDGYAEAWGNLAITYMSVGNNDSARIAFYRAYTLRPKLEKLSQNIGAFELGLNQYTAALKAYQNGLIHFPDDVELLYGVAFTYYSLGTLDSAQKYLNKIGISEDTTSREFKLARLIDRKEGEW